jgi:hypothetical protein
MNKNSALNEEEKAEERNLENHVNTKLRSTFKAYPSTPSIPSFLFYLYNQTSRFSIIKRL